MVAMEIRQPTRHAQLDSMPIDGQWRPGRADKRAMRGFSTEHWISVQHEPRSYPF